MRVVIQVIITALDEQRVSIILAIIRKKKKGAEEMGAAKGGKTGNHISNRGRRDPRRGPLAEPYF